MDRGGEPSAGQVPGVPEPPLGPAVLHLPAAVHGARLLRGERALRLREVPRGRGPVKDEKKKKKNEKIKIKIRFRHTCILRDFSACIPVFLAMRDVST